MLVRSLCVAAESPWQTTLFGRVTVSDATWWLDGGSVTVLLRDERGTEARIYYEQTTFDTPHAGHLSYTPHAGSFTSPRSAKATILPKHSPEEKELLHLLTTACVNTFGTSNPEALSRLSRHLIVKHRAMASLFLQIDSRDRRQSSEGKHK